MPPNRPPLQPPAPEADYEAAYEASFDEPHQPKRPRPGPLAAKLTGLAASVGTMAYTAGAGTGNAHLAYDGTVILAQAEALGRALDKLARENPAIRRALEKMVATTAWTELGMVSASILVPIMACHGFLPADAATVMGAAPPPPRPPRSPKARASDNGNAEAEPEQFGTVVDLGGGQAGGTTTFSGPGL